MSKFLVLQNKLNKRKFIINKIALKQDRVANENINTKHI